MLIHVWGITPLARQNYLFTSESVSEGHPDKVCDRISDAVLDAYLTVDPQARVACETLATTNRVVIAGEVRGPHTVLEGIDDIVRECVRDIGYDQQGFSWKTLDVSCHLHEQSAHIAQGVDSNGDKDEGAGDQGIMFGFATDETPELMPAPVHYAHRMLKRLAEVRKSGEAPQLGPDAKSQLTVRYEGGRPVGITSLVLSTQHIDDSMTSAD
ncbi:MAG: S-adenosylmethionine synthetase, partial [Paracoccaceae bacterium]